MIMFRSGLVHVGDRVLAVDGVKTNNKSAAEVASVISSNRASRICLQLLSASAARLLCQRRASSNGRLLLLILLIGVIYGGTRGTGTPHTFWSEGYRTYSHLSGRKGKKFAVTCCQQKRLSEINTVFGRSSTPDPTGRAHDALPDPRVGWGGDTSSPFSSPLASRVATLGRFVLLLNSYPTFDQLRPWHYCLFVWQEMKIKFCEKITVGNNSFSIRGYKIKRCR